MVVSVYLDHVPPERTPFIGERFERERLRYRCETLNLVVVYYRHQVVELVMRSEKDGLPIRAFIALAVAHDYNNAVRGTVKLRRERHSRPHGEAVTQGTCGKFNP